MNSAMQFVDFVGSTLGLILMFGFFAPIFEGSAHGE